MASQIFPFAVISDPQAPSNTQIAENNFLLFSKDEGFTFSLRNAKLQNSKSEMIRLSTEYVASVNFVDTTKKINDKFIKFLEAIDSVSADYQTHLNQKFGTIFSEDANSFISGSLYTETHKKISESIVAACILPTVSPKSRSLLVNLANVLRAIQLIASGKPYSKQQIRKTKLVLPDKIFPLPAISQNIKELRRAQEAEKKKIAESRHKKTLELTGQFSDYTSTIDELRSIFDNSLSTQDEEQSLPQVPARKKTSGFLIVNKDAEKLSQKSKMTLQRAGINTESIDIVSTVAQLEKLSAQRFEEINSINAGGKQIARIGNTYFPVYGSDLPILEVGEFERSIGPCPTTAPTVIVNESLTEIISNGSKDVRVLGIANLMMVEQELARYELGEIAHIENVLKSEVRDRKVRTNRTYEESELTETEETDTKENDLTTTERFELQVEIGKSDQ